MGSGVGSGVGVGASVNPGGVGVGVGVGASVNPGGVGVGLGMGQIIVKSAMLLLIGVKISKIAQLGVAVVFKNASQVPGEVPVVALYPLLINSVL